MERFMELLRQGVTASHTISYVRQNLVQEGFQELSLEETWNLVEHGKYYVNLYGTNAIAFVVGGNIKDVPAFRIAMAHSDYPNFQLKPNPCMRTGHGIRFNVEIYGGMYQKSWLDRPLGVAGKIVVKGENAFAPKVLLYRSEKALCIIPSLAIHMDRELNKKGALDTAKELVPVASLGEEEDLLEQIAQTLSIRREDILDYELSLYNMDAPVVVGLDQSMVSSPRLDNLTSTAAIYEAILDTKPKDGTVSMMVVFDNEEVGSLSKQGADSSLLPLVIQKIANAIAGKEADLTTVIPGSFLLSVDVAHAHHPNYEEKSDATNKAYLGNGFCIKRSISQRYGTTAESAATLKQISDKRKIPYTIAVNKTGIPGGSTLGPIVTSHLPMPCADIGMPILSMHSACELGALKDYVALRDLLAAFYRE